MSDELSTWVGATARDIARVVRRGDAVTPLAMPGEQIAVDNLLP